MTMRKNAQIRWKDHLRLLRLNKHHSQYLQNAWNKYGENAFEYIELRYIVENQPEYNYPIFKCDKTLNQIPEPNSKMRGIVP